MILRLALLVVGLAQRAICGNEGSLFVQTSPTVALEWDSVTQEGPILHLNELSTSYFSTFTHPSYPNHAMRIKETKGFCDPTVKSYTGFIDIEHGKEILQIHQKGGYTKSRRQMRPKAPFLLLL